MSNQTIQALLKGQVAIGTLVRVQGWVRSKRDSKAGISFLAIHDGSHFDPIQAVVPGELGNYASEVLNITTGCAVEVAGKLVESEGKGQAVEIQAEAVTVIGWVDDPETYPIAKKRHSFEYLRTVAHLRPRTNTFGAMTRVRTHLAAAIHNYFYARGFHWINTPLITASDCEGAGELFRVSTLDLMNLPLVGDRSELNGGADGKGQVGSEVDDQSGGSSGVNDRHGVSSVADGQGKNGGEVNGKGKASGGLDGKSGASVGIDDKDEASRRVDFSQDFFGAESYLTVSGQLNVEAYCLAMSRVYTFGPTFRAENSNTSRHLAEFWMVEPEIAFADLAANADLAEDLLKQVLQDVLNKSEDDIAFFQQRIDDTIITRLRSIIDNEFERMDYAEAVKLLEASGQSFEFPVKWGLDLQSEHERYLTEQHVGRPVVVMNYPTAIKAFYMRLNDDEQTVAAMDVLAPGIGEIVGGSQREERLDVLDSRMDSRQREELWWYRDLRRYGTVPHAGFGLGFERLLTYITGMDNIRDAIPFPRTPGSAPF